MIYDYKNATGSEVIDVATGNKLYVVQSVNLETNTVTQFKQPFKVLDYVTLTTFDTQYQAIDMVFDNKTGLCVFYCHGKI